MGRIVIDAGIIAVITWPVGVELIVFVGGLISGTGSVDGAGDDAPSTTRREKGSTEDRSNTPPSGQYVLFEKRDFSHTVCGNNLNDR